MSRTSGDQSPKVREAREARDQTRRSTIKDRPGLKHLNGFSRQEGEDHKVTAAAVVSARGRKLLSVSGAHCLRVPEFKSKCLGPHVRCWSDSKSKPHHKLARGRTKAGA